MDSGDPCYSVKLANWIKVALLKTVKLPPFSTFLFLSFLPFFTVYHIGKGRQKERVLKGLGLISGT